MPDYTVEELQQYARAAAEAAGVPVDLIMGILQGESGFNPNASGDGGSAVGIAQIWPQYHPYKIPGDPKSGPLDPHDPFQSIDYLVAYVKRAIDKNGGDVQAALPEIDGQWHTAHLVSGYGQVQGEPPGSSSATGAGAGGPKPDVGLTTGGESNITPEGPGPAPKWGPTATLTPSNPRVDQATGDKLNVRPWGQFSIPSASQQETGYYFPFYNPDPNVGGPARGARNIAESLGQRPDTGNPFANFIESLAGQMMGQAGILTGIGQGSGPQAWMDPENLQKQVGQVRSGLQAGQTSLFTNPADVLHQIGEIARKQQAGEPLDGGQQSFFDAYMRDPQQAVKLLSAVMSPNMSPFLQKGLPGALSESLLRYQNAAGTGQEPGGPIGYILRSMGF